MEMFMRNAPYPVAAYFGARTQATTWWVQGNLGSVPSFAPGIKPQSVRVKISANSVMYLSFEFPSRQLWVYRV